MAVILILVCSFVGGAIGATAGGGGLILLPALLIFMPQIPLVTAMGTNKFAFIAGSGMAAWRYTRSVQLHWPTVLATTLVAGIFSYIGAHCVSMIPTTILKPLIFFLMIGVLVFTLMKKDLGKTHRPRFSQHHEFLAGGLIGVVLGFYNGFFGPGSGTLMVFGLVTVLGYEFIAAAAATQVICLATDVFAVAYFAQTGQLAWRLAIFMALGTGFGAYVGAHSAMLKGSRYVRIVFTVVVSILIARLGYNIWFE